MIVMFFNWMVGCQAEATAHAFLHKFRINAQVVCAYGSGDEDGYVSCSFLQPDGTLGALECRGSSLPFMNGCRQGFPRRAPVIKSKNSWKY